MNQADHPVAKDDEIKMDTLWITSQAGLNTPCPVPSSSSSSSSSSSAPVAPPLPPPKGTLSTATQLVKAIHTLSAPKPAVPLKSVTKAVLWTVKIESDDISLSKIYKTYNLPDLVFFQFVRDPVYCALLRDTQTKVRVAQLYFNNYDEAYCYGKGAVDALTACGVYADADVETTKRRIDFHPVSNQLYLLYIRKNGAKLTELANERVLAHIMQTDTGLSIVASKGRVALLRAVIQGKKQVVEELMDKFVLSQLMLPHKLLLKVAFWNSRQEVVDYLVSKTSDSINRCEKYEKKIAPDLCAKIKKVMADCCALIAI